MSSLGTKRRCTECAAPFYDLNRDPIVCPKCGAVHQPVARLKSDGRVRPQGRTFARREPVPVAAEGEAPAAAADEPVVADADEEVEDKDAAEDELLENDEDEDSVDGEAFAPGEEEERDR